MKSFINLTLALIISVTAKSQINGERLATVITQRMKDSLNLSDSQVAKVQTVNIRLHYQKLSAWNQYKDSSDLVLTAKLQQLENSRDPLYYSILTAQQFSLYIQKKKNLVNSGQ